MKRFRFKIEPSGILPSSDVALVDDGEDIGEMIMRQVWQDLGTDLEVTIGGVTMFAAAWEDPTHWAEDWAEKLDVDRDEVPDAVIQLFANAEEGS